jgi:hypothetical protein
MSQEKETTAEAVPDIEPETIERPETGGPEGFEEYPEDHPLVKTLAKQKAELRELRKTYSDANKQLEEYRKSQLTEQERLIEQTKEETARAIRFEYAEKLVDAELKTSLKGRTLDAGAVLDFNKKAFITDTGDIDSEALATWVEAHSTATEAPKPDLGQGPRGNKQSLAQIRSRAELENMTPAEILAARKDGRLDSLMGKA